MLDFIRIGPRTALSKGQCRDGTSLEPGEEMYRAVFRLFRRFLLTVMQETTPEEKFINVWYFLKMNLNFLKAEDVLYL